jgi:hypothetical protein
VSNKRAVFLKVAFFSLINVLMRYLFCFSFSSSFSFLV